MKPIIIFLFVLSLFVGCGSSYYSYNVEHLNDAFDGFTIDRMSGNYLTDTYNVSNSAWLNVQKYKSKNDVISYHLIIEYWDSKWLFIGEGESLVLLVDGERIGFTGEGSKQFREVESGTYGVASKEKAFYSVTVEQLRKISNAKEVKIKIQGSTSFATREFSKENFQNIRRFILECIDKK